MKITIKNGMRGLLFRAGTLVRVLEPGAHRVAAFLRGEAVELVDVRERALELDVAPVFTRDAVPVGVTGFVAWTIVDPTVITRVGNVAERLANEARAAVAGAVAQVTALELAPAMRALANDVQDRLALEAKTFGVAVASVGLTGVRFPRRLRRLMKTNERMMEVMKAI
jgi:regulator of protease activity HflC (stomatin/prohibitin superfamily)